MFNVWINDGTTEMPSDDILYIVSKEGIFLKKKLGLFESMAPVDGISILNELESYAHMDIYQIPGKMFSQVLYFFIAVLKEYKGEANVIIHYNQTTGNYKFEIPEQKVAPAGTAYESEVSYKNFVRLGTIHSHCNFSAFHSPTDKGDEATWDGLHITIGDIFKPAFSCTASIVANGTRFVVNPTDYVEGLELTEVETITNPQYAAYLEREGKEIPETMIKKTLGYKINVDAKGYPAKWMSSISKKEYKPVVYGSNGDRRYGHWGQWHRDVRQPGLFDGTGNTVFPDQSMLIPDPGKSYSDLLFRQFGGTEWNPCEECPYKNHKVDLLMESILEELDLDDDQLEKLGFEVDDEQTELNSDEPHNYIPEHYQQEGFRTPEEAINGGVHED